jgi:hypothetical protein
MAAIEFSDGTIAIDAVIVAEGLAIAPQALLQALREGAITNRCELGVDADAGHYRLTFFSRHRRFRVVVDAQGAILSRSSLDFGEMPLPRAAHRPGA